MLPIGFFFAFSATLGWAIAAFPLSRAARLLPSASLNHLRLLLAAITTAIIAMIISPAALFNLFSAEYSKAWLWLGASGIIALGIGDFFSFRSYAILGAQHGSVLTTLSPAAALFAGMILVNEHINYIGIIGMLITIIGVMSISLGRTQRSTIEDHGHGSVVKGIILGVLAACCHGSALAFSKKGFILQAELDHAIAPVPASFIRVIAGLGFIYLITLIAGKARKVFSHISDSKEGMRLTSIGTLFNPVISGILSMVTILYVDVAVAQTIFATVPLFAMVIAFGFYREKITSRSIAGAIAALVGVALLIWRVRIAEMF